MEYERLCDTYNRLAATTKRLEMTDILVEAFQAAAADEIARVVYLTQGKLRPDFEGVELGLADKLVVRALAFSGGAPEARVTQLYHASGDLGDAAAELLSGAAGGSRPARQTTLFGGTDDEEPPLTVAGVHDEFLAIARASGAGSQDQKLSRLQALLLRATPRAARYIIRTVTGKLRLGIADMTLLDALSIAFATKEDRPGVERAYNVSSDLGHVATSLAAGGLAALDDVRLSVGVPVRAMLAERLPSAEEILEKLGGEALVEYKYDGLRMQAHVPKDGPVRFFSRRLEDLTAQFPDVARDLRAAFKGQDAIVEGEAVAVDPDSGEMRPFQDISGRRGRKYDLDAAIAEIPVKLFLFDALLIDGVDVTGRDLPDRRAALEAAFTATERIGFSHAVRATTTDELVAFFDEAVGEHGEGIMCKSVAPGSAYRAGARGFQWIKYKRDYASELSDTLDLVAVGAFAGRGRRKGWYGALLMAAYNAEEDVFETVCKLGTGFDDATLAAMGPRFEALTRDEAHPRVRSRMVPDTWFTPGVVAEVLGAELTVSPVHTAAAGAVRKDGGIAVRFPRFTGRWRDDKAPEQATTTQELLDMYRQQGASASTDEGSG